MTDSNEKILIRNLKKIYVRSNKEEKIVFNNLNMEINVGKITSILGKSGCGKSTLLNIISGFEPPTSGEVFYSGNNTSIKKSDISVIFQENTLLPWKTVIGNLQFGLRMRGIGWKESKEIALENLKKINLDNIMNYYPHELSAGMYERVALLRAFICNTKLVIMDEAFSALDFYTRIDIHNFILKLYEMRKFTAILITHDIDEAVRLSNDICILSGYPAENVQYISNPLPYPRLYDSKFNEMRQLIIEKLRLS